MASLTPGVLSKLLENAGSKVTAAHRQALLQVTEIVPRLSSTSALQTRGYFIKLSDSLHSAFVSVPDDDAHLICSDKLQLGHFVYITRLDRASPVPIVRGLTVLPKRHPCVGNPTELLPGASLHALQSQTEEVKKRVAEKKVETRRLSLDSARRVWDHSPVRKEKTGSASSGGGKLKHKKSNPTSPNVIDKKLSTKADSPLKSPTSSVSPLKKENENLCPKSLTNTPLRKSTGSRSPCGGTVHTQLVKVPLNFKTWSYDTPESWDDLSPSMCDLAKQVVGHRNFTFLVAVRSLEEASATDTVIQCMCMFAELCKSYQTHSAGSLVKQFLELHLSLRRVLVLFDSLLTPFPEPKPCGHSTLQCATEDAGKVPSGMNAISWVQAAIGTNLSRFNLFEKQVKSEVLNDEKCHYVVIENSPEDINTENATAQSKQNRATQASPLPNSIAKRLPSAKRKLLATKNKDAAKQDQSKGIEIKVAVSLAEKLLEASSEWFLEYLEESLRNEFGLKNEVNTEIASLLGQLKQVNHWLDNLVGGDKVDRRVEKLRKKLYRFLLEHVNSTIASN
ncbi:uncharacterized protein LOC124842995 [Vigna umbellata]|uniref:uncharacterized protein LOC124842995 n=1 Tax=Vigna umbellata TaxID=87088 RepID=UPI001F5FA40A|nr:uncharacterized protein LOC124842995 [Vigna umbellata]